jgi:hypothetical protein
MVSTALAWRAVLRSSSVMIWSATRIEPMRRPFSSWPISALKSCSSVTIRSRIRNWPSDSRGSFDHEEKIWPSRRMIRFLIERRSRWRVPVFCPAAIH